MRRAVQPPDAAKVKEVEDWLRWTDVCAGRPLVVASVAARANWTAESRCAMSDDADVLDPARPRDGPTPGFVFVSCGRRPGAVAASAAAVDGFRETFVVSVARSGTLSASFDDGAGTRRTVSTRTEVSDRRRDVRVNVLLVPTKAGAWNCRIDVDPIADGDRHVHQEFACRSPADAARCVKDRYVPEDGATLRLLETGGPLTGWRWLGADADPSRPSARWRLDVGFAPDGK